MKIHSSIAAQQKNGTTSAVPFIQTLKLSNLPTFTPL
jgi:hypothetical protein